MTTRRATAEHISGFLCGAGGGDRSPSFANFETARRWLDGVVVLGYNVHVVAMRSGQIQQLLGEDFALHHLLPNGDCFYEAVAHALSTDQDHRTPSDLRAIVANSLTEETMELFRMTHEAGVGGFEFMLKISDLDTLKERHLISGRDTSAGTCIWANDYAISTISTHLQVCLHIMDEESGRGRSSARGSSSSKRRKMGTFVTIRPEAAGDNTTDDSNDNTNNQGGGWRHIILQRTRRQHYNLIVQRLGNEKEDGDIDTDGHKKKSNSNPSASTGAKNRPMDRAIFRTLPQSIQRLWEFE